MMTTPKHRRMLIALLLASIVALWMAGCSIEETVEPYPAVSVSETYSGTGPAVYHVPTDGSLTLTYDLDLGSAVREVYMIYTNPTSSLVEASKPSLASVSAPAGMEHAGFPERDSLGGQAAATPRSPTEQEVNAFNSDPFGHLVDVREAPGARTNRAPGPFYDSVGVPQSFMLGSATATVAATCRRVVTDGTKTLNIWVADDCWTGSGSSKAYKVDDAMLTAVAERFLASGAGNDIYDWVTNIYGSEWGPFDTARYPNLIAADNEITILLYDIDNDNSTNGGYLGYFFNKDNFKKTGSGACPYSNERIMFYLDAVMLATPSGGSWDVTDPWPAEIVSTLAHEFQHMVHFYQKTVVNRLIDASDAWLNEMCSLVTEDFLSAKLQTDGPRGVAWNNSGSGSQGNYNGRIPLYNAHVDDCLTYWGWEDDGIGRSYSQAYSFGAYIARNYGGVSAFRSIVRCPRLDTSAVPTAIAMMGYSESFSDLLRKWGAAVILSSAATGLPSGRYQYNYGSSWNFSTLNSIQYDLGSINFFNYSSGSLNGPRFYDGASAGDGRRYSMSAYSNAFYRLGTGLTGHVKRTMEIDDGMELTVVVK